MCVYGLLALRWWRASFFAFWHITHFAHSVEHTLVLLANYVRFGANICSTTINQRTQQVKWFESHISFPPHFPFSIRHSCFKLKREFLNDIQLSDFCWLFWLHLHSLVTLTLRNIIQMRCLTTGVSSLTHQIYSARYSNDMWMMFVVCLGGYPKMSLCCILVVWIRCAGDVLCACEFKEV